MTTSLSLAPSAPELPADYPDLSQIIAQHTHAEDQYRALEIHMLQRFETARKIDDAIKRKNAFWAIADALLQQNRRIISRQSRLTLAAPGGKKPLRDSNGGGIKQIPSDFGALPSCRTTDLDPLSQANRELRLFNLVLGTVTHVIRDLAPHAFIDPRRQYNADLDGDYPLRWTDGTPAVLEFEANQAQDPDLDPTLLERIKPYVDPKRSTAARRFLYHANLYSRRLNWHDLLCPQEKALVGQAGVFAKRLIPEAACIGIYGGTLLEPKDLITIADRRYLAKAASTAPEYIVNGENILSLMNTRFLFDADGRIAAQDTRRYNVLARPFRCTTKSGVAITLTAFFSAEEIEQDNELRWNYGYDEAALIRNGLR